MPRARKETERVQPTFTKEQMRLIRSFKGIFGDDDSEIVRAIVTNWLLEHADITKNKKEEL
jgi:hypothetical protein